MPNCIICDHAVDTDDIQALSDGTLYHQKCLKKLEEEVALLNQKLFISKRKIESISKEIQKQEGFFFNLTKIFKPPNFQTDELKHHLENERTNFQEFTKVHENKRNSFSEIYNKMLTYPPDWDERRTEILTAANSRCKDCSKYSSALHVHHVIPLKNGGTNELSNLIALCESCHSNRHGGKSFRYDDKAERAESAISKRIITINEALENNAWLTFQYKKPQESKYATRTVQPIKLKEIPFERQAGKSLCLEGYCQLRNAKRTFALRRMKNLHVTTKK